MKKILNTKTITLINLRVAIIACTYHCIDFLITGSTLTSSFSTWSLLLVVWFLIYMNEKSSEKVEDSVGNTMK